MSILKMSEIRKIDKKTLEKKFQDLMLELMKLKSQKTSGAAPENPGKMKELRHTIARIKTLRREKKK